MSSFSPFPLLTACNCDDLVLATNLDHVEENLNVRILEVVENLSTTIGLATFRVILLEGKYTEISLKLQWDSSLLIIKPRSHWYMISQILSQVGPQLGQISVQCLIYFL